MKRVCDSASGVIRVPEPWGVGSLSDGNGYIIMDYIKFSSRGKQNLQSELGRGLALMHSAISEENTFGFPLDGCCGAAPQLNNVQRRFMSWVDFWREFRLGAQLSMAKDNYPKDTQLQYRGAELSMRLEELFCMLNPDDIHPSLLHGDLWSGNYSADEEGKPCIYDPAAYYGHSEADLGIAYMFGGFD